MKKFIKRFFKILGVLLLLLIAAIIILPIVFKDKIVEKVKQEANNNLNATVNFGEFDLSLFSSFPDFRLTLNDLSVVGINEFKGDSLIALKTLKVDVNLMSVIKGDQYKINSILLDNARINALVLKDGKANWDIAKPSADTTTAAPSEPTKFKMMLSSFEIKNTNIVYDDAQMGMRTVIVGLNHTLKGDFTQDNFLMETLTTMDKWDLAYGGVKYLSKVKTSFKVDMDMDMLNSKYTFKENEFDINDLGLGLDGWIAMPKDDIDMDIKFVAKKTDFKSILSLIPGAYTKDFEGVKASGKLALDAWVKGKYNDKVMPAFGAKLKIDNANFQYPSLPKAVNNIFVDIDVKNKDGQPDNTLIDINRFHVEMAQNPVDVVMHVSTPVSDPNINGTIKAKIDLVSVKEFIPLEADQKLSGVITSDVTLKGKMSSIEQEKYDEFNAAGKFAIANMDYKDKETPYGILIKIMELNFTPQTVELTSLDTKIGKSDIRANGKMDNLLAYVFKDELLKGTFNMNSTLLDLNEFMTEEEGAAAAPSAADTASSGVVEIPGNIDFVLNSTISKLIYDNINITNVSGAVVLRDSKVDMRDLKMNLLDGSMVMNGSYDAKNPRKAKVAFDMNIVEFDVQKTVKTFATVEKMAPIAKKTFGKFSTKMTFNGVLNEKMEPELNTLNGAGVIQTKSVSVKGQPMFEKIGEAMKNDKIKNPTLQDINASFEFKDGRVTVKPFDIKWDNSKINIAGSTGFDNTIDYKMRFEMPRKDLGGAANTAMEGLLAQANTAANSNLALGETVKVNALVGGTSDKPTVKLDMKEQASSMKDNLKDAAKAELDKQKEALTNKAKEEADKLKAEGEAKARAEADRIKKEAEAKAKAEADKLKDKAKDKAKDAIKDKFKLPK
ncbi:MAG: AsmA-like C-terminal region-containing protein [Bacteroidota bacterium]